MEQYSLGVPIRFFSPVDTCRQQQPCHGLPWRLSVWCSNTFEKEG